LLVTSLTLRFFFLSRYARKYAQSVQVPLQFRSRIGEITVVHDVVAVEHTPGLVTGYRHRGFLGNAGTHDVPYRRPA